LADFSCGDASLEMVFDYWGHDINQYSIMNVARTTREEGTSSFDMVEELILVHLVHH